MSREESPPPVTVASGRERSKSPPPPGSPEPARKPQTMHKLNKSRLTFWLKLVVTFGVFLVSLTVNLCYDVAFMMIKRKKVGLKGNDIFIKTFKVLGGYSTGITLDVQGAPIDGPAIYLFNHQSGLDALILALLDIPRSCFIAKKELGLFPVFGQLFSLHGNILIDRKNKAKAIASLDNAAEAINSQNASIIVFPEGTRSGTGYELLPLKKGAFHLALTAKVPLVPVMVARTAPFFDFEERRLSSGSLRVDILPPIDTSTYSKDTLNELVEETHSVMEAGLALVNFGRDQERASHTSGGQAEANESGKHPGLRKRKSSD